MDLLIPNPRQSPGSGIWGTGCKFNPLRELAHCLSSCWTSFQHYKCIFLNKSHVQAARICSLSTRANSSHVVYRSVKKKKKKHTKFNLFYNSCKLNAITSWKHIHAPLLLTATGCRHPEFDKKSSADKVPTVCAHEYSAAAAPFPEQIFGWRV